MKEYKITVKSTFEYIHYVTATSKQEALEIIDNDNGDEYPEACDANNHLKTSRKIVRV